MSKIYQDTLLWFASDDEVAPEAGPQGEPQEGCPIDEDDGP